MLFTIEKDFAFSAAHHLVGLREGHKCGRPHGHNYVVRVRLSTPLLDEHGFVLDYGDLAPFGEWLDTSYDHRDLNEVLPAEVKNPTAENLARHLAGALRAVCAVADEVSVAVGVSETPKTFAWYCE